MMETFSAWLERKGLEEQPILNTWEFKPPKKKKKKKLIAAARTCRHASGSHDFAVRGRRGSTRTVTAPLLPDRRARGVRSSAGCIHRALM